MDDYNTQREPLILKEYGRNIQNLVNYLCSIEDREKRNENAKTLVELMRQLNPSVKDSGEDQQKLWDDLVIMSDFKLDIDGPFPKPKKELLYKKPDRLRYKNKQIRFKHYGLNIHKMVEKAIAMEDPEEKEAVVIYVGRLMKSFASIWNHDNLDDAVILENIKDISNGRLSIDMNKVKENNLFEPLVREKSKNQSQNNGGQKGGKRPRRKRN